MSLLNKFRPAETKKSLKDEIFEHICDLLNIKKGFGSYQDELGLDSYLYIGPSKIMNKQTLGEIKQFLEKFESRIKIEDIRSISNNNPFYISIVIECKIQNVSHVFKISFHHNNNLFTLEVPS